MFQDREEAARILAQRLIQYKDQKNVLILAIPRGGLVLGKILAETLHAPLDIILTKKISYPGEPEAAAGAVSLTGYHLERNDLPSEYVESQVREIQVLLRKRYRDYHGRRKPLSAKGKIIILVDDGIATGSTMLEAIRVLRKEKVARIIVAVPVGPIDTVAQLWREAEEVICLQEEPLFFAIGAFYRDFEQVSDEEAKKMLKEAG